MYYDLHIHSALSPCSDDTMTIYNIFHMAYIKGLDLIANNGDMIKPILLASEEKSQVWKENAFTEDAANTIKEDLIQTIENVNGNARDMKIQGLTIAGKTGTAELKTSNEDTESGTLGWFDCFTVDRQDGTNMLIVSMVENIQDNAEGGSHYLISKIRTLFE